MARPPSGKVPIMGYHCHRCEHEWIPRIDDTPKVCPRCKSPYWDRPRKVGRPPTGSDYGKKPENQATQESKSQESSKPTESKSSETSQEPKSQEAKKPEPEAQKPIQSKPPEQQASQTRAQPKTPATSQEKKPVKKDPSEEF